MNVEIREMTPADYGSALALWKHCEGIGLSDADERAPIMRFLSRNPGLCFTAWEDSELIGTCLCGTDGRRGYLYHLAVDLHHRRQGIGKLLVQRVFEGLRAQDIQKCHIMVYGSNETGLTFWKQTGWVLRPEIVLMSYNVSTENCGSPC